MKILIEKLKSMEKKELQALAVGSLAFIAFIFFIFLAVRDPKSEEIFSLEKDCQEDGRYWHQESCYNNINEVLAMLDVDSCGKEGFYWYDDICNEKEEEISLELLFSRTEETIINLSAKIEEKKEDEIYEDAARKFQEIEEYFLTVGQDYINQDYKEDEMIDSLRAILSDANKLSEEIDSGIFSQDIEEEKVEEIVPSETTPPLQEVRPTPPPKELTEFEKRVKCINQGDFWYNNACNKQPQQAEFIEETPSENNYIPPELEVEYDDYHWEEPIYEEEEHYWEEDHYEEPIYEEEEHYWEEDHYEEPIYEEGY